MKALVATLAAMSVMAQDAPPVLRVTSRLVQVSVIVTGKGDKPVTGLTKEDFTLLDKGKPQEIQFFAEDASGTLAKKSDLPPNVFSNKLEHRANTPTAMTVILFDMLNTTYSDQMFARDQLIQFLQQLKPTDRVALCVLGNELKVLHDFTSDASALLRTLGKYSRQPVAVPSEGPLDKQLDTYLAGFQRMALDFNKARRGDITVDALTAIATHVARLPGRKNLVWISNGFPMWASMYPARFDSRMLNVVNFHDASDKAARALNNSNMAIYPVDARGLFSDSLRAANQVSPGRNSSNAVRGGAIGLLTSERDVMQLLAAMTGGRAFFNTNDLSTAIRTAIEDSSVTYNLGYHPANMEWNGKFRPIKVQVKRPGVHVRHRQGYFALAEQQPTVLEKSKLLQQAVWSPLDATELGLVARIELADAAKPNTVRLVVNAEARGLQFETAGELHKAEVDMLYLTTVDGRPPKGFTDELKLNLSKPNFEKVMKSGLTAVKTLELPPGAAQVRVVMRDAKNGAIGSVTIPLHETTWRK